MLTRMSGFWLFNKNWLHSRPQGLNIYVFVLTDLSKDAAGAEGGKGGAAVVGDHYKPAALDDVHLLADVALAAHVVTGAEHLQRQPQHQLHQQAGLAVLEEANAAQRVQVHVDGELGLERVGQRRQHAALVQRLLVGPQVVEPANHPGRQHRRHPPKTRAHKLIMVI